MVMINQMANNMRKRILLNKDEDIPSELEKTEEAINAALTQ